MEDNPNYNKEDMQSHYAIGAIIKDESGRILMQKHNKYGFWTIPIGKVLPGQLLEEALSQELLEECNIQIEKVNQIGKRNDTYERNGKDIKVKARVYEIIKYSGEIKNNEPHKHEIQEFKTLEEIKLLQDLSDTTLCYLETLGITRSASL